MTRLEIVTHVAQMLGDTSSAFVAIINGHFDEVLRDLAARDALRSLWRTRTTGTFTYNTRDYDTRALTGVTTPDYPLAIKSIIVPTWGPVRGHLERKSREEFDRLRLLHVDATGTPILAMPRYWRLYPNEFTLQVDPVPRAEDATVAIEVLYLAPPSILGDNDLIIEVRAEHLPVVIAGLYVHGLPFDDEARVDRTTALGEYEAGIRTMKRQNRWDAGRPVRTVFRDF